jgi:hypothetical protein
MSLSAMMLRLLAVLLLVTTSGCGRGYTIEGIVVFLPSLNNGESSIEEVTQKPMPDLGTPVPGAEVVMYMQMDSEGNPKPGSEWTQTTTTDWQGRFKLSMYAAPYDKVPVGLQVKKDGYKAVITKYIDYAGVEPQVFYVVLVPASV